MRMRIWTVVWQALALGCGSRIIEPPEPEIREVRFAPYLAPCPGIAAYPCLVDQVRGTTYPTDAVHGFAFEWGVSRSVRLVQRLKVKHGVDTASWAWDADTGLARRSEPAWSFRTTLIDGSRWTFADDTLRIEGYGFPITLPIAADRTLVRRGYLIFELEVTPYGDSVSTAAPGLQAKMLQAREIRMPD